MRPTSRASGRTRSGPAFALVLAGIVAFLCPARPAGAQERFRRTPPLPDPRRMELALPPVRTQLLANGLTVATARLPGTSVVTLQVVIRAGAVDAPPERPALADITARMIGKGTKMLSADYLENMIESLGADFSASVFMDYTVLTLRVLGEEDLLDRAIYVLRLMVVEASFNERELGAVRRTAFWELGQRRRRRFRGHRRSRRRAADRQPLRRLDGSRPGAGPPSGANPE
jgi:zinc protease